MVSYKVVSKNCHKGTGDSLGLSIEFEGWSDAQIEKYGIDLDAYDHTDVVNRSAVLIKNYWKQRTPYLTIIHLWDKQGYYLLSSRHEPLKISLGEGGMVNDDSSISSPSAVDVGKDRRSRKRKEELSPNEIAAVMKSVIDICNNNKKIQILGMD